MAGPDVFGTDFNLTYRHSYMFILPGPGERGKELGRSSRRRGGRSKKTIGGGKEKAKEYEE